MLGRKRTDIAQPDPVLFLIVFTLACAGLALCYSASALYAARVFSDPFYFLKRQLVWFFLGFGVLSVVQNIDYHIYLKQTRVMLLLSFVLLVLVLVPGIGHSAKGSVRWLCVGPFGFQPSEFVKLFMVIYVVKVFSSESKGNPVMQFLIPVVVIAVLFVLILLQPDFSTAMDLLIISGLILFVSGFPAMYLISLGVLSLPMFYLLVYQVDYRRERLLAFMDPWKDRFGNGYHVIQSYIAFKKGGLIGAGLGRGTQKISRLPEPHTDFIFAVIAEELGLAGTICVVILFCTLFYRAVIISLNAQDDFGRLLAIALGLFLTVQAFMNIGVVTGSLPATGMPLPFISYGGSSMICSMTAAGILLNISRYQKNGSHSLKYSDEAWK